MPPSEPDPLSTALRRNIEAMKQRRSTEAAAATRQERAVETITAFMGSMAFVHLHLALYGVWTFANLGIVPDLPKFDPKLGGVRFARGAFPVSLRADESEPAIGSGTETRRPRFIDQSPDRTRSHQAHRDGRGNRQTLRYQDGEPSRTRRGQEEHHARGRYRRDRGEATPNRTLPVVRPLHLTASDRAHRAARPPTD
jgi:hypothetical protein